MDRIPLKSFHGKVDASAFSCLLTSFMWLIYVAFVPP